MTRILVILCFALLSQTAKAAIFYVDPSSTASTATGALATPWKTLDQVNANMSLFNPGDQVLFKRGQKFSGTLTVTRSGTSGNPITFGAYGTGADPLFWGTGATINMLFYTYNRSYVTFYGLSVSDTTISATDRSIQSNIQRAFYIDGTSTGVVIRKCKIDRVGVGFFIVGPGNIMDSCDIGNLRMVKNTPTTVNNNDDYGANPVVISSANNRITNCYFHDCWANSYDYVLDGGGVELYGNACSNNFIGYNTFYDCNGILECGSGNGGIMKDNVFAYNKMINNSSLFYISSGGSFAVTVKNLQFYNNVVVENTAPRLGAYAASAMAALSAGSADSNIVVFKNNIFWLTTGVDVCRSGQLAAYQFTHENNIYRLGGTSYLNFTANPSELSTSTAAIFSNSAPSDPIGWNYRLTTGSPAINFGQNVGINRDFEGVTVPATPHAGLLQSLTNTASPLTVSASSTTAIACNGGSTSVTVSATGGVSPYTGTGTFTVSAGTHTYTVTDANGTSASTSISISQPSALTVTVSAGTISVSGGTTSVTVTAGGNTSPYTYSLNNGSFQSSNVFATVGTGTHNIQVKDSKGCLVTKTVTISLTATSPLTITLTPGTAIACNGGTSTVTVSASGGVAPYTGTGTFTVSAGTYTYSVTDALNLTASGSITISQPSALSATLSNGTINTLAGTTSVTVTATGGTPSYTYSLNNGTYQTSNIFSGVATGTHTIRIKDSKGCILTKSLALTATPTSPLTASVTKGTVIACNGGTTTVTISASGGFSPYTGTGTFTVSAGTYNYTITDASNTSVTASVTITQPNAITATLSNGLITTIGGRTSITVNATGGTPSYTYSLNGGTYQTSNVFTNVASGTHTIRVKDSKSCILTKTLSISVTPVTPLNVSVSAGTIACKGESTTVTVSASGGIGPYTGTGTFTVTSGSYTYAVTDALGASDSETITISQPQVLSLSLASGTIASNGGTTTLTASVTGGIAPYQYRIGTGNFQTSNVFSNIAAGTYTVAVLDANNCSRSKEITITEPPKPFQLSLVSKSNITCRGRTDGKITVSGTNGYAPYRYKLNSGSYGTGNVFSNLAAGTYTITGRDSIGTTSSISVTIAGSNVNCNTLKSAKGDGAVQDELPLTPTVTVYPNPSQSYFRLQVPATLPARAKMTVTDIKGRIIEQGIMRQGTDMILGERYAQGIYILTVYTDDRLQTFKLIKTR